MKAIFIFFILLCLSGCENKNETVGQEWLRTADKAPCLHETDNSESSDYIYHLPGKREIILRFNSNSDAVCQFYENESLAYTGKLKEIVYSRGLLHPYAANIIRYGMSKEDILQILGPEMYDIGSGASIYAWKCTDGSMLTMNMTFLREGHLYFIYFESKKGDRSIELFPCENEKNGWKSLEDKIKEAAKNSEKR